MAQSEVGSPSKGAPELDFGFAAATTPIDDGGKAKIERIFYGKKGVGGGSIWRFFFWG